MNMGNSPTTSQLEALLSQCTPSQMNGVWVDHQGNVHIEPIEKAAGFFIDENEDEIKFIFETLAADYVGPAAAKDEKWVTQLFKKLEKEWSKDAVGYVD